jgi:hypothetical protein
MLNLCKSCGKEVKELNRTICSACRKREQRAKNVPKNVPNVPKNVPKNVPNVPKNVPNVPKNVPKNVPNVPKNVPSEKSSIPDDLSASVSTPSVTRQKYSYPALLALTEDQWTENSEPIYQAICNWNEKHEKAKLLQLYHQYVMGDRYELAYFQKICGIKKEEIQEK